MKSFQYELNAGELCRLDLFTVPERV
jgi:hypothetical protein